MLKLYMPHFSGDASNQALDCIKKTFLLFLLVFSISGASYGQLASHVVISEVYGGGGNSGATYKNDFIELYNPTNEAVSLNGWSVQYASATGTTWNNKFALPDVSIPAKGYYLIKAAGNTSANGADLPGFDATATIDLAGANGKVALVSNNVSLTGANPTETTIIDLVGYGTANGYEGTAAAPAASNSTSVERKANSASTAATMAAGGADATAGNGYDSNNNSADFVVGTPNPQHLSSGTEGVTEQEESPLHVVISEVYGGAGNTGSPFKSDFIELYNPTNAAIDLTGWSVQYTSATNTAWTKTNLPAKSIPAKGYFLIKGFTGTGNADLPEADDTHNGISISALSGKVVLVNNNVTVTGANPTGDNIVDKLGWGTANGFETAAGPGTTITSSIERKANNYSTAATMAAGGTDANRGNAFDSDDNSFDFIVAATPTPQNMASAIEEPAAATPAVAPTVATNSVTQIKARTATANGALSSNGGAKITERGFVYAASETAIVPTMGTEGHMKQSSTSSLFTNTFSENLTGLTPQTKYYLRAFATNEVGTEYGSVQEFTTEPSSYLSSLHVSAGSLSPAFISSAFAYTVNVENFISSIDIAPSVSDPAATVQINGEAVTGGVATKSLSFGDNVFTILVTEGENTTTYTLTVNRATTSASKGMAGHLVISEIYGGAGNDGPFSHDFVELYNPTDAPISVGGWSVQVAAPDGSTWTKTNLPAKTIPAKGYFLIQGTSGSGATPISTFDDFHSTAINIFPEGGKVALVNNNVFLSVANPAGAHIVDKVGWGGTPVPTGFEGSYAPAFTATTSLERKANSYSTAATMAADGADAAKGNGFDSNDNSFDFIIAATPNPEHLGSAVGVPGDLADPVVATLTTTAASDISHNAATVGGNITANGGSKVEEKGIVYMASAEEVNPTVGMEGATKLVSTSTGTDAFTETITGLSARTKYFARAYAMNAAGTSYGNVVEFTTTANANLSALVLSAGTLTPVFAAGTNSYTAAVSNSTYHFTVTPTAADANATITVNGTEVASGATSAMIPLAVGNNTITTVVTGADGTTKTYTVVVTREGDSGLGDIANHVVISEVAGGGGNTTAPYQSDYVELYNPTSSDIVMTDWSVQHAPSDGTTWTKAVFTGTIKAKGYFLIRGYTGAGLAPLENYDATVTGTSTLSISAIRAKVVLVNNSTTVTGANPTGDHIVDKLGWGSTGAIPTGYETTPAGNTSITTAIHRKAHANATAASMAAGGADAEKGNGYDSNNNFYDFVTGAPDPQWSGSATESLGETSPVQTAMVSTTAASTVRLTSAVVGGNVTSNGGTEVTERGVVYMASETEVTPTIGTEGHTKVAMGTGRGAFSETLTGLMPRATYYVRAYATNAQGTTYGALESFTTVASTNANLSALAISEGTLTPSFDPAVKEYNATVEQTVTSITVTPTLADAFATVTINGAAVASGSPSAAIELAEGTNTIMAIVTAEDGTTTNTYTLNVYRTMLTSISDDLDGNSKAFALTSIYPNPMQAEGAVKFRLPVTSAVQLQVFSLNGVKVLEQNLGTLAAGNHDITWYSSAMQENLTSGVYILRLVSESGVVSKRFVVRK